MTSMSGKDLTEKLVAYLIVSFQASSRPVSDNESDLYQTRVGSPGKGECGPEEPESIIVPNATRGFTSMTFSIRKDTDPELRKRRLSLQKDLSLPANKRAIEEMRHILDAEAKDKCYLEFFDGPDEEKWKHWKLESKASLVAKYRLIDQMTDGASSPQSPPRPSTPKAKRRSFPVVVVYLINVDGFMGKKMSTISFSAPFGEFLRIVENLTQPTFTADEPRIMETQLSRLHKIAGTHQGDTEDPTSDALLKKVNQLCNLAETASKRSNDGDDPLWFYETGCYPMSIFSMLHAQNLLVDEGDYQKMLKRLEDDEDDGVVVIRPWQKRVGIIDLSISNLEEKFNHYHRGKNTLASPDDPMRFYPHYLNEFDWIHVTQGLEYFRHACEEDEQLAERVHAWIQEMADATKPKRKTAEEK